LDKSNFKMTIYYSSANPLPIEDLEKFFIKEDIKNVIFTIMRDEHGCVKFEPFEVKVPENFNINKCYNDDFVKVHDAITNSLNKNESGLYLFHGEPGTGKTTYIKHLSSLVDRDIIYVPTAFVESLSDPSFLPALLHKKHSILVIEDAEKALLARDPSDSSSVVSAILNITDGIMANVFNIAIIATYNSSRQSIDKALLRKGRLKVEYQFGKLSVNKTQKIMDELDIKKQVSEPMILADIYNDDEGSIVVSSELLEEKIMGFR
jgi:SpoVK/Ycf46/Vps4 family AAA+-type ATPase